MHRSACLPPSAMEACCPSTTAPDIGPAAPLITRSDAEAVEAAAVEAVMLTDSVRDDDRSTHALQRRPSRFLR
eukprot:4767834-Prymnesium_polylepis.1